MRTENSSIIVENVVYWISHASHVDSLMDNSNELPTRLTHKPYTTYPARICKLQQQFFK